MTDLLLEPDRGNETVRPYWEGFEDEEVRVPRCADCGEFHWYPLAACPHCGSENLAWEALDGPMTLFTWVEVRYDFGLSALEGNLPVYSGLVVPADDERIRLPALIDADGAPEIGMELAVEFRTDDGTTYPVYVPK